MQNEIYTVDRLVKWVSPTHVLVRWSGYSRADDTVEPVSNMPQACVDELIERKGLFRRKSLAGNAKETSSLLTTVLIGMTKTMLLLGGRGLQTCKTLLSRSRKCPRCAWTSFCSGLVRLERRGEKMFALIEAFLTQRIRQKSLRE